MTIYINGKFLCQQKTGTQIYAYSMLKAMQLQNIEFTVLSPKLANIPNTFTCLKVGSFKLLTLWEQISLPLFLLGKKEGLLLNFSNSAPLFGPKQIITVHDLAFEKKGVSWFTPSFKYWYRFLIPRICKKATFIFTVSDYSKQEITKYYHVPKNKIQLVPNVLSDFGELAERQIKEDYLLVLSAENPRKNAQFAVSQLEKIQAKGLKLVLVSTHSKGFIEQKFINHPALIQLNYQSEKQYYSLIKHARALVYLSEYEGFGIPVLESLSLKTKVICLELAVFKESFGDLPIYMKTLSTESFEKALNDLRTKECSEIKLQELGTNYSYEVSGKAILNTLNKIE